MDKAKEAAQEGLDPDVAELLGIEEAPPPPASAADDPDFQTLFSDEKPVEKGAAEQVDTTKTRFSTIVSIQEDPKPYFQDKEFYKKVLGNEGDQATRVHDLLGKYMKAEDPEEKSRMRNQLISAFWDLGERMSLRAGRELVMPKRLLLRFGILSPGFLTPELQDMVSRIIYENTTGEPVYYADEWLERITRGQVRPSTVDEVKAKGGKDSGQRILDAVEKKKGQRDTELSMLKAKILQLDEREAALKGQVDLLMRHERNEEYGGLKAPFTGGQKAALAQVMELLRQLSALDQQIAASYASLGSADKDLENLKEKSEGISVGGVVDQRAAAGEWQSLRQMAKMCVGRQGNHFPIFHSQFVRPQIKEIGTRENVIREMAGVESMDPGLFMRQYKTQSSRIVPNVILLACYGDAGVCWEPFEKFNRATSRGRVAIPMFSKNLPVAVITAMADLRWQVAKEKAAYYWMEEGITGKYYQWFSEHKLRGDVREYFIRDYALWITKESQGMQKLDKDVRGIFWRMMPFPQHIKDALRNRSFVYNELYKKDQNIAKSDGY